MQNSTSTIIALFLVAILIFIVPLVALSGRVDNVSQENIKSLTEEFVTNVKNTGKLSLSNYDSFITKLAATGNAYNVDIELQILDENPSKKVSQSNYTKIGENVYYSKYTTQILEQLEADKTINLKKGDLVTVDVKNNNTTLAQTLKKAFYGLTGNSTYAISASSSGMVSVNGN